jgi:putative flippase GtrA
MQIVQRVINHPVVRQQGKFLAVGLICTVVDFGVFNALGYWIAHWPLVAANTASFVVSCAVSFALNRLWTFERTGKVDWAREAVPFLVVSAAGWGLQTLAIWAAGRYLSTGILVINLAKIAGVGTIWFLKFYLYRNFVFADRRPSAEEAAAVAVTEVP